MTDRLNELNDKIADLERRLDVAEKENTELKKQLELANGRLQGYLTENGLSSIA